MRTFFLNSKDKEVLASAEFRHANQNAAFDLVRLATGLMGFFAAIAFISVAIIQKGGDWGSNWLDSRQLARLGIALFAIFFLVWASRFREYAIPRFEAVSTIVWVSMSTGLLFVVLAQFKASLSVSLEELPHGRYAAAVIMVTIVIYVLGSLPVWKTMVILTPVTTLVIIYNFRFLSKVEASSYCTYFVIAHSIGATFCQFKLKRDTELFVKNRDLDVALQLVRESEAREKEISAAKTRLIGSVSHDLRQPLNSLALYNNLLKSKFGGEQNAALNSIAERVQECVSAMEGNLTRLQDIAQLQAKTIKVDLAPIAIRESLHSILTVFQPIAEAAKVDLVVRSDLGCEVFLQSHPERLFEILANLLSNAIKFSSAQPQRKPWVLLRARLVRDTEGAPRVHFIVRDNGLGIAPENHQRIFDEYVQLNNPERQSAKGYGLGLSVVRELTDSLEGHSIAMRSRLGYGATFVLSAPLASTDQIDAKLGTQNPIIDSSSAIAKAISNKNHPQEVLRDAQIILIEDDESLRAALTAQLEDLGANVRAFPSTKHALAATANDIHSSTCVISDYWLPEPFDGLKTISLLREQLDEDLPALLISAATDIDPARLQSMPSLEFALKPVSAQTLQNYVAKHLRRGGFTPVKPSSAERSAAT